MREIDAPLTVHELARLARGPVSLSVSEGVRERMRTSRAVLERALEDGEPVYGLNTGLGSNVAYRLQAAEVAGLQEAIVRGRVAGVGEPLALEVCRAALICRTVALAAGGAAISPHVHDLMVAMLACDVTPVIASRGSVGAGDLSLLASVAAVVIGRGEAWVAGSRLPGAQALAAAGLAPAELAAKDALAILNGSAVSCAMAALVLEAVRDTLLAGVAAAVLACEGFAANPRAFDPRVAAARPAGAQEEAAALLRRGLAGSRLGSAGSRVQDPLCFRALPQVTGSTIAAFGAACDAVEVELNAVADNPLVLAETGEIYSTANFHTPAIALAFDTLAIALHHVATASAHRSLKLMTGRSSGLPEFLAPAGGAAAGLVPLQKTISALHAEIRLKATPASLDGIPVSDGVEDLTPQTALTIRKLGEQVELLRLLVAIEAMTGAQACDLRATGELGEAARALWARVRQVVPTLAEDRESGPDVDVLNGALWGPDALEAIAAAFSGVPSRLLPYSISE
jgi:histidine ammonia-lyase